MKYIIEIDGINSTRYTYNVWSVFKGDDGIFQDERVFASDDKDDFINFISSLPLLDEQNNSQNYS